VPLGHALLERGALTADALASAVAKAAGGTASLGEVLVDGGLVDEATVLACLAEITRLPVVDLKRERVDPAVLAIVPPRLVAGRSLLPLRRDHATGALVVATADPLNLSVLDELRLVTGCEIQAVIASAAQIAEAARDQLGLGAESIDQMIAERAASLELADVADADLAEDRGLIRFVNQLLVQAVRERTSDIHIEPFEKRLRVRYRVDGVLEEKKIPAGTERFAPAIASRLKIMADLDIAEKRVPQDGRIKLKVDGREYDVRVSIIPTMTGEDAVLRILDSGGGGFSLESLGMPADTLEVWERLIRQPNGIILVTGPTGSGKSTSLHAALSKINEVGIKIITIEDPVEYHLDGVNQIQVNEKAGMTFSRGLRSILRHDPDIVMVGEIRDLETAEIAIRAALTGHLVFSTLHTNDAPSAVTRLLDMGLEPFLVASSVEGIMAQRLVRLVCKRCMTWEPRARALRVPQDLPADLERLPTAHGCEACRGTGYTGRNGLFELMPVGEPVRDLVIARASAGKIREHAMSDGMRTLRDDGWRSVRAGLTTLEEVLRVTKAEIA